jgi:HK97 family phage portal protein
MTNRIDRATKWVVERYAHARNLWKIATLDSEDRNLLHHFLTSTSTDAFSKWNDDELRRIAANTSWIYACAMMIGQEFSGAPLEVKQRQGENLSSVVNHPLELLLRKPNPYCDLNFIWRYTMWWMQLRGNAFWFLAPEAGNPKNIAEIWPVPADKITPIPDKQNVISGYAYKLNSGQVKVIKPQYIVHFMYPNPFSLIDGMSPLSAAALALETEQGTSSFQRDTYVSGRGVPHTIISLSEDMGDRDFIAISSQIREDFEKERKVIVARSGDIKATQVGLSQKDMDLIGQREFTRDELDVIFLGIPMHGAKGDELRAAHKFFIDNTIHPLHLMIAGQLNVRLVQPYYGDQFVAEFEDVRAQDRALNVQEFNVYSRVYKLDEARALLKLPKYENPDFPGMGDMLVALAGDPQFMMAKYGLEMENLRPDEAGGAKPTRKKPTPNAAMNESDAPVNQLSDAAKQIEAPKLVVESPQLFLEAPREQINAALAGQDAELTRYKKVALKAVKSGKNAGLHNFSTDVLSPEVFWQLKGELLSAKSEDAVKTVFESTKEIIHLKAVRRKTKDVRATDAYEAELMEEFLSWSEETADALAKAETEDERESLLEEALAVLLLLLLMLGRKRLPEALELAYENADLHPSPDALQFMVNAIISNEKYLTESLIPDIKAKIEKAYQDPDIQLALVSGDGAVALRGTLSVMNARVGSYSGEYFAIYQYARGVIADANGKRIRWNLEPLSQHCQSCLEFGDKTYDSFAAMLNATNQVSPSHGTICMSRCRCFLTEVD